VGPEVRDGGTCELLANSTESLPAALSFGPSTPWPEVNANLTAADNIALRSISWMCWRQQKDWDAFGQATHNMIVTGNIQGVLIQRGVWEGGAGCRGVGNGVCMVCSWQFVHAARA
jgi:hypothetical protein